MPYAVPHRDLYASIQLLLHGLCLARFRADMTLRYSMNEMINELPR
ncbi:MAG: hypothetical protein AVDCRST_MAG43-2238 [uncultured Thermomicrobiales bacterium]|uniref:Uncharacterized protein n=1 Tax=uncultured Thermomicrobiales bacterium TaxID=1645740 RepID=A0A6J4UZF9_9BACT|nr:MAG: hypothetical protein AVDCRST_MAG43-2238 [uncultured Thermomicrobiales bacterium]